MAKSLRSKWKKKMRAAKRVRYGQRELETLKKTVAGLSNIGETSSNMDITVLSEIATVTDARTVIQQQAARTEGEDGSMEVDAKKYNKRTMKDENGKYPPWFNQRKLRTLSIANKKTKRAKREGKKKSKSAGKRRNR